MEKDGVSELGFDHERGVEPDPLAHPGIYMSFLGNFYTSFLCHQHCLEKKRYLSGVYKIFPSDQGEISHGENNRNQSWVFSIDHQVSNICGYLVEKAVAPHSSTLAWKIPWTEESSRLQSMGSLRVVSLSHSLSCIGEGNGNPLQCSCLENPRVGGVWSAAVFGVAQSQT